jgi:hypothetical protein
MLTAAAIVAVAAITVISRQRAVEPPVENHSTLTNPTLTNAARTRTYITRRVGGQDINVDTQTGEIKPLTPQEAQQLAEGLAPMLDTSSDGLVQVKHGDGSVSMDLQGRFHNVTVARVNTDGTIEQSCVDNPRAAAHFFGVDPSLIENARTARKRILSNQE